MHLDEEQLQRLLHGELAGPAEASARGHVAACAECRRRAAEAEREEAEVHALLRSVDHPGPSVGADAVTARARAHHFHLSRAAAAILLALGVVGAAAYAAPGSPLRAWVGAVVEWIGGGSGSPPAPVRAPDARIAGIAIAPGRQLLVLFTSSQAEGRAQVSLTEGAEVVVRAPLGAATFTSDVERLVIDNRGSSATFEIQIPRSAPRVEIRVDGARVFLKEGARVITEESEKASGSYAVPLAPPGS